jgi:C4-type Zn-finger protein
VTEDTEDKWVDELVSIAVQPGSKGKSLMPSSIEIMLSRTKEDYEHMIHNLTDEQKKEAKVILNRIERLLLMFREADTNLRKQDRKNKIYFIASTILAVAGIASGIIIALVS